MNPTHSQCSLNRAASQKQFPVSIGLIIFALALACGGCAGKPTHIATAADITSLDCGPFPEQYATIARNHYLENAGRDSAGRMSSDWPNRTITVTRPECSRVRLSGQKSFQDLWILAVKVRFTGPRGMIELEHPLGLRDGKVVWEPKAGEVNSLQIKIKAIMKMTLSATRAGALKAMLCVCRILLCGVRQLESMESSRGNDFQTDTGTSRSFREARVGVRPHGIAHPPGSGAVPSRITAVAGRRCLCVLIHHGVNIAPTRSRLR